MRSKVKGFGSIVPEILSEICEDPTYARFSVLHNYNISYFLGHSFQRVSSIFDPFPSCVLNLSKTIQITQDTGYNDTACFEFS